MNYDPTKSMLLTLRNAAKVESDKLIQFNLKLIADELSDALKQFAREPTGERLTTLTGHWAHGVRMLPFVTTQGGGDDNGSGLKEGATLTEAA